MDNTRTGALIARLALAFLCFVSVANPQQESQHHTIVPLKAFPPDRGGETVSGDPNKPGAPFVIRIRNDDGQIVMPHWHPEDEHINCSGGTQNDF
jgi:hypothetical protein